MYFFFLKLMQKIVGLDEIQNKCQNIIPGANTYLPLFCCLCFHLLQCWGYALIGAFVGSKHRGKKHAELDDELPSPPGGGSPQLGLKCSHTIQKAPASSFTVLALCIKKGILSYSSAPSVGSKLIQNEKKRKLYDASFLPSALDSKFFFYMPLLFIT